MPDPTLPLTGGCICGGVRFEVSEPLLGALFCHCKRCQRRTGTGVSTTALTAPGSYRTVSGQNLVRTWDPGDGGYVKAFCSTCGSQMTACRGFQSGSTQAPRRELTRRRPRGRAGENEDGDRSPGCGVGA
jgi:hypothetical protein